MRSDASSLDDTEMDPTSSASCWWRSLEEFASRKWKADRAPLIPRLRVLREMERLALVADEGLEELRHKLTSYKAGDLWLPAGGVRKDDMVIPSVVTVLLVGLSGAGKSALVNSMYSVLGRSGIIPFAQTSNGSSGPTTMFLEEHNVLRSIRSGFCLYDTRGLDMNRIVEGLEDVKGWMACGVRHYQPCLRPGDMELLTRDGNLPSLSSARFCTRQVNSVLVVADVSEIYESLKAGDSRPLEATAELFRCPAIRKSNENPLLVLTHGDKLSPEDRIDARIKICGHLGISEATGAYDIACLMEKGILPEVSDPVTAFALTEMIYRSLIQSDRTYLPKRKPIDWVLQFLSFIMCAIASFFAFLALVFSKLGRRNKLKI
ncbi:hypothetical protein SAY87_023749 [Trapa incisa]|uniref:Uncharacterized protein n=1 Tax=Trapa incisa TaxID=236973 RepID=A0AAN7QUJ8_9MYRT|nr:hypothetical protein SAY87_023749 [Trapa incisa]